MVHRLLISSTHTKPIYHNDMSLPNIVHGKNLSQGRRLSKNATFKGTLVPHTLFKGKSKSSLQPK
jgi:hypothetical protein